MSTRLPTPEINTELIRLNYGGEEGEEMSPRAAVSTLCDVVDEYRALVGELYGLVPNGWRYCLTDEQKALFEAIGETHEEIAGEETA